MKKKAVEYTIKATKQDFAIEKIHSSLDAFNFARKFYFDDINIYESSFIMMLNSASNVMGYAKISQGGICSTVVDVRIVAKYAIETLSTSVILIHNHPSGNLNPSQLDDRLTNRLKEALSLFDIKLLDHIIISETDYYSYSDEGKIF